MSGHKNSGRARFFRWAICMPLIAFVITHGVFWFSRTESPAETTKFEPYHVFFSDLTNDRLRSVLYESVKTDQGLLLKAIRKDDSTYCTARPDLPQDLLSTLTQHGVDMNPYKPHWTEWILGAFLNFIIIVLQLIFFAPYLLLVGAYLLRTDTFSRFFSFSGTRWANLRSQTRKEAGGAKGSKATTTLKDIAGCKEAKQETAEIIAYLKDPTPFQRLGARLPKGVLLSGLPGTGKTLLARAIAGEASVPFLACSGSEFDEKYVGVGASRIRQLFQEAKRLAPCLIFVDEIDSIGQKRSNVGMGRSSDSQTLNQLLIEMDGFEANEHIIVFAATNRPEDLDPALVRPGRFDRQVVLNAPDLREREEILKVHASKIRLIPEFDFSRIARLTVGFVGAELANLVNEGALCAARDKRHEVNHQDFEQAFDRILMGLRRSSLQPTPAERERTAYHEAGHAIVSMALPGTDPIYKLTILPRGAALGVTQRVPESDRLYIDQQDFIHRIITFCAGRAAESFIYGEPHVSTGASAGPGSDFEQATKLARAMVERHGFSKALGLAYYAPSPYQAHALSNSLLMHIELAVKEKLDHAYKAAMDLLRLNETLLHAMKDELMRYETLEQPEIKRLLERVPIQSLTLED